MDWATFFKEYQGVITVVSGLLIAILGYLFGKWNSERMRKWELRDKRIKEAQVYLDTYRSIVERIENLETAQMEVIKDYDKLYEGLSEDQIIEKIKKRISVGFFY